MELDPCQRRDTPAMAKSWVNRPILAMVSIRKREVGRNHLRTSVRQCQSCRLTDTLTGAGHQGYASLVCSDRGPSQSTAPVVVHTGYRSDPTIEFTWAR
jgi:hypothetical protein